MKVDSTEYDYLNDHQAATINEMDSEFQQRVLLWLGRHRVIGIALAGVLLTLVSIFEELRENYSDTDNPGERGDA